MELNLFIPDKSDWLALLPEIAAVIFGVLFMILGAFKISKKPLAYVGLACAGILTMLWAVLFLCPASEGVSFFNGMFGFAYMIFLFPLCAFFTIAMAVRYFDKLKESNVGEFLGILFVAVAALSLFSRAENLMAMFICLETSAICFYALIAWGRRCAANLEGSLRYLILSGATGAFLLLGIAFVYGASFKEGLNLLFMANFEQANSSLFFIGIACVAVALLFKLSAFPFQFWSPDVYGAAPVPVTAFLATASKSAAFIVVFKMLLFMPYSEKIVLTLSVCAGLGILIGSLGGLNETKTKRIVAFSGITNAGYFMVALASFYVIANQSGPDAALVNVAVLLLLVSYILSVYGVMFVQNLHCKEDDSDVEFGDFAGLSSKNSTAASTLAVGLSSLAGVPPSAGFFAKLFILIAAYLAGLYWLMFVLIAGSVASIYYYFKWLRAAYSPLPDGAIFAFEREKFSSVIMLAISVSTLLLGVILISSYLY